jgi:membrane-associated protease RseP (regulator of RpoE activity)
MKNFATRMQYFLGVLILAAVVLMTAFMTLDTRVELLRLRRALIRHEQGPPWTPAERLERLERHILRLETALADAVSRGEEELELRVAEAIEKRRLLDRRSEDKQALEDAFTLAREDLRAFVGLQMIPFEADVAAYFGLERPVGALVVQVSPLSPAERAGIERLDVITRIGEAEVADAFEARRVLRGLNPGEPVAVELIRLRRGRLTLSVTPEELADWVDRVENPEKLILRVQALERRLTEIEKRLQEVSGGRATGEGADPDADVERGPQPPLREW